MLVSEQVPTSDLTKALSRRAGNRHSDGISSIVSADDRSVIINGCYEMMIALKAPSPRAQALEVLFDAVTLMQKHDEKFEGEIPLATIQKVYTAHADAIRALSPQPVADHVADAGKMVTDGWLPIETAPKDGTQILIEVHPGIFDVVCWSDNAWREGGNFMRLRKEPTRYLPLPASPGASE